MAEPEKNPLQQLIDWVFSWKEPFEWLRQRIGLLLTVVVILSAAAVVAAVYTWRNWQDIQKLPGVPWIVARFRRRALPKASADRLTIAVAQLASDNDREHEKLLLDELRHFEGVETIPVPRAVDPEEGDRKKADAKARVLRETGADVLIWSSVVSLSGNSFMRLYWGHDRIFPKEHAKGTCISLLPFISIWQPSCATKKASFFSPWPNHCANVRLCSTLNRLHYSLRVLVREDSVMTPTFPQ